ncbi:MAG: YbfB/YjiJ family MFS transporter [Acetobacteraceae bacterium]
MTRLPASTAAAPFATSFRPALGPAVGGLLALAVGIGIGRFVYTPILPPMVAGLGLSKFAAGLIASANFAGYLAGALFASGTWLPGTRRAWLLGGLAGSAVTTGAMGLTHAMAVFLVLRFAGGVASALVLILVSAIVLESLAEAGRSGLVTVLFAGVGVGIAGSAVLVSVLRAAGQGWPALWLASGALSLLAALIAAALIPPEAPVPPAPPRAPGARADHHLADHHLADRRLLRLVAAYGLFGFGYVITATFLVAIVRSTPAIRPLEPVIWVVFGLAAVPSVALWTVLARRFGLGGAFALAALVEALGVLASVVWQSTAGVFAASVLVGGTFMGLTALGLVRGRELARGDARRVLGLMTSAFGLGQILGPSFAGALSDRLGSFTVPSIVAAATLVAAAALAME